MPRSSGSLSESFLLLIVSIKIFSECKPITGNYKMPFETYMKYMENNHEDMPIYLFDKTFCRTAPQLASDFHVPTYFSDDLFSVLGEDQRPDYRCVSWGVSAQVFMYS